MLYESASGLIREGRYRRTPCCSVCRATQEAAKKLGISLVNAPLGSTVTEAEYKRIFDSIQRDQVDGIVFSAEFEHYAYRFLLVQLVQQIRLPAIHDSSDQVEAGGLMSYAIDVKAAIRTIAMQTVEILDGSNPGDMPYVQAVRFAQDSKVAWP